MLKIKTKQYFNTYDGERTSSELDFLYCPKCGANLLKKEIDGGLRNYCSKCKYIQYINPIPGVSIIIVNDDNKILIGRRSRDSIEGDKWCLPCGFIEHHENYLDAAHREVLEETGLEIEITSLIDVASINITPYLHTIVIALTARVISGTLKPGDDLVELFWLSKDDSFPEMAFEGDEYTILKYFEGKLPSIPIDPRFRLSRQP